jgi:hypothetical protein
LPKAIKRKGCVGTSTIIGNYLTVNKRNESLPFASCSLLGPRTPVVQVLAAATIALPRDKQAPNKPEEAVNGETKA